jgi:hypothetical protein
VDLSTYSNDPATFSFKQDAHSTVAVAGIVYRAIPHASQEPLDSSQSVVSGGRWNRPGGFPVLYTGASVEVVRSFVDWHATYYGLPLRARSADYLPDLIVLTVNARLANLLTDDGLTYYKLPIDYPIGFPPQSHNTTRPIGQAIFEAGLTGIASRSATMTGWSGPIQSWADVAIFTSNGPSPQLIDRFHYEEWY